MLKEVFESISEKMKGDFDTATKMVCHPVVKGTVRENALMKYLRPHIPDKFEFSEGVIIETKLETVLRFSLKFVASCCISSFTDTGFSPASPPT